MTAFGYYVVGESIICPQCGDNPMYNLVLTEAEEIGYPDGYTCTDCGTVIESEVRVPEALDYAEEMIAMGLWKETDQLTEGENSNDNNTNNE